MAVAVSCMPRFAYSVKILMEVTIMINPASLFKIKGAWETFAGNHPKFPMFLHALSKSNISEGTIIEIHVKKETGEDICTNVKLTASDMALVDELKGLAK